MSDVRPPGGGGSIAEVAHLETAPLRLELRERVIELVVARVDHRHAALVTGGEHQRAQRTEAIDQPAHVDQKLHRRLALRLLCDVASDALGEPRRTAMDSRLQSAAPRALFDAEVDAIAHG